jgi:hypothetical protein
VQTAAGPADALTPAARRALWLEISALYFMPSAKPEGSVWGTYFGPSMTLLDEREEDLAFFDQRIEKGLVVKLEGIVGSEFVHMDDGEAIQCSCG